MMAAKQTIVDVISKKITQNAGTRDGSGHDTTTFFGIPGSGLPRRHCNVDVRVNVAVCEDLSIYVSINNGRIYQSVHGRDYICRIVACTHMFYLDIPNSVGNWDGVRYYRDSGKTQPCDGDIVGIVTDGTLSKGYEDSYLFDWVFGAPQTLTPKNQYDKHFITEDKITRTNHNGGTSVANSKYTSMGKLTDYGWAEEMQDSDDGHIYLCGGIMYESGSIIDSTIMAEAVEITIPGLNTYLWYYPGDVRIEGDRMSCDRKEGYFYTKLGSTHSNNNRMEMHGKWRDCKNARGITDAVKSKSTVFRRVSGDWKVAELTGEDND